MLEVRVQLLRIAEVLSRHEPRLREARPPARAQQCLRPSADPVAPRALLELGDPVVLAAEGDEVADGWVVAPLDWRGLDPRAAGRRRARFAR
ncbi:hypothetical protein CNMCM8694_007394 [Aspergillus lentulus]|nr:hypothetical protein CNMCM8694_007394 [Aspergillus lentulus]